MKALDVERVHDILADRVSGRQVGHSTAMLVCALQQADFDVPFVVIVGAHRNHAEFLHVQFRELAACMGYDARRWSGSAVTILGTSFVFVVDGEYPLRRFGGAVLFQDHFVSPASPELTALDWKLR